MASANLQTKIDKAAKACAEFFLTQHMPQLKKQRGLPEIPEQKGFLLLRNFLKIVTKSE